MEHKAILCIKFSFYSAIVFQKYLTLRSSSKRESTKRRQAGIKSVCAYCTNEYADSKGKLPMCLKEYLT